MKRQIPKNIRQIGNVSDNPKIYVEDYVDTFFNQLCDKADQEPIGAFLIGETVQEGEEDYIYVYGAIRMEDVSKKGKDIHIQESAWKKACELCKEYFGDSEILGWFLTSAGLSLETNHNLLKLHQKFFAREKSIFVMKEAREKEEKYFVHKFRDLMECGGHYIFYEKNVEMQNYMIASRKRMGMTPSEIIEDTVTKNFRSMIQQKMDQKEPKHRSKFVYGLSTFLVLVVLVIGITMINNFDKIKRVQSSIDELSQSVKLNNKEEKEEVVEAFGEQVQEVQEEVGQTEPEKLPEETSETPSVDIETPDGTDETETPEDEFEYYTVVKGDTLASISKKTYGDISHVDAICRMNGLENGNLIFIGQKLLLP